MASSSGENKDVNQVGGDRTGKNMEREKNYIEQIQTLFLEILRNPPQLHHMTFQKENATLLPRTLEGPDFIQWPRLLNHYFIKYHRQDILDPGTTEKDTTSSHM